MKQRFIDQSTPSPAAAGAVFVGFAILYMSTAAESFLGGDAGLFAVVYADGGTAHPPGYPLYSAYLRAMGWLPTDSPAHGASVATASIAAAAVALLYDAMRRWSIGRGAALFGVLAFGLAPHVWTFHTEPEVFALNHLLITGILWAAAPRAPVSGLPRIALLGLLAGLGIAHHHPVVFLAPLGIWALVRGISESEHPVSYALGTGLGALAIGLLPYLYLLAVARWDLGWHWRDPQTIADLVPILLRRDYGTLQLMPGGAERSSLQQIAFWGKSVAYDMYVVPVVAAAVGIVAGCSRRLRTVRWRRATPTACWAVVATLVLSGPVFASLLPIDPSGVGYIFFRKFHLQSELLLAFLAGLGVDFLLDSGLRPAILAVAYIGLAAAGVAGLQEVRDRHDPSLGRYVRHTFEPLPEDALVVGSGDHHFFGSLYLQRALDRRHDVDYIGRHLYAAPWYRRRVQRQTGLALPRRGDDSLGTHLVDEALATGRPVFVTGAFDEGLLEDRTIAPFGTLIRVYDSGRSQPPVRRIFRRNLRLYRDFDIPTNSTPPPTTWARDMREAYARIWDRIARGMESVGADELARRARLAEERYAPWRSPSNGSSSPDISDDG